MEGGIKKLFLGSPSRKFISFLNYGVSSLDLGIDLLPWCFLVYFLFSGALGFVNVVIFTLVPFECTWVRLQESLKKIVKFGAFTQHRSFASCVCLVYSQLSVVYSPTPHWRQQMSSESYFVHQIILICTLMGLSHFTPATFSWSIVAFRWWEQLLSHVCTSNGSSLQPVHFSCLAWSNPFVCGRYRNCYWARLGKVISSWLPT